VAPPDVTGKGYPLFSKDFGEIKVIKYSKEHEEEFVKRQF
jgi:hypothetical protein